MRRLCNIADVIALQETWLLPHDLAFLGNIDDRFAATGTSAVDTSAGVLRGRPYGGVGLLWRKDRFPNVLVVSCKSVRLAAIKVLSNNLPVLIFSVYMPTDCNDNLIEFIECLSEINAIIESQSVESVFILGDFNAHPGELFAKELMNFCEEQSWSCLDFERLAPSTYTFVSDAHGCQRWLDHCLATSAARQTVRGVSVLFDTYWSDHYPLLVESNLNILTPKIVNHFPVNNKVKGGA